MRSKIWEFVKKIGKEVDQQFWTRSGPSGAAELVAALYSGTAYVMYGHSGFAEQAKEEAKPIPEQEPTRERRGRTR